MKILIVIFGLYFTNSNAISFIVEPGPQVIATVGKVWPRPRYFEEADNYFQIDPNNFEFTIVGETCDILENAVLRYKDIIKLSINSIIRKSKVEQITQQPKTITKVYVNLTSPCERMPHLKMDEWYYIIGSGRIISHSIWGILRGLESYSQLITPGLNEKLIIPEIHIRDDPRFPHRGLLLDTSRHYMTVDTIFAILDGMAYNKLNVFHWHIVDDQSFPYQSVKFPELSEQGAYTPSMIYTQENISNIIEYARMRGIRVVAEFDVPGHTRCWGKSHPEILTQCGPPYSGKMGPINPINNAAYDFLHSFYSEVLDVFPDKYMHVGGDEVGHECWKSNNEIKHYIETTNISYPYLQKIFMERITKLITNKSVVPIVWQEAMVDNVIMPEETLIQVWTGNWRYLLNKFTNSGHRVLLSECWYLDHLATGGDWIKYYRCDPYNFPGNDEQKKRVIGGEACMWSEVVNNNNVIQRIFPRVSAVAERLWSTRQTTNIADAKKRLEEHTCRLILRGVHAQPSNGPGIC